MDRTKIMDRAKTMERLKKRREFLAVAGGAKAPRRGFLLQMGTDRRSGAPARFGFTVTKKMGNSPERNRIRRRLREAVRLAGSAHAEPGADYVLVGRRAALSQPFDSLISDLISSLATLRNGSPTAKPRQGGRKADSRHPLSPPTDPARDPGSRDPFPKDLPDDR